MWRSRGKPLVLVINATALLLPISAVAVQAHSGPPFPIVSDRITGPYEVSVWTDPDATDDGSLGGQFWVTVRMADDSELPADTAAVVTIKPLDRPGSEQSARAAAIDGNAARQFAAVLMDHEGRFAVRAEIRSGRGTAVVDATVDATYDLRPPPVLLVLYLLPFVAVGFLWLKMLRHRRSMRPSA